MTGGPDPSAAGGEEPDDAADEGQAEQLRKKLAAMERRHVAGDRKLEELELRLAAIRQEQAAWNRNAAGQLSRLVELLHETAQQLLRIDDQLGEIERRHPDPESDLPATRFELLANNRRIVQQAELLKDTAGLFIPGSRPTGAERPEAAISADDARPGEPVRTASSASAARAQKPDADDRYDLVGTLIISGVPLLGILTFALIRLITGHVPGWADGTPELLFGMIVGPQWAGIVRDVRRDRRRKRARKASRS